MTGYNVQRYKDMFLHFAQIQGGYTTNPGSFTDSLIFNLFSEAQAWILGKRGIVDARATESLADGTMSYDLPSGLLGLRLGSVEILDSSADNPVKLDEMEYQTFIEKYDIDSPSDDKGTPAFYTIAVGTDRKILLGPSPDYAATNGIIFTYKKDSSAAYRNHHSAVASKTAAIAYGATAVTISSADPVTAKKILAGDEFGIVPTANADGETVSNASPIRWYKILTAVTTTLTLAENYDQPTETVGQYITAQVLDFEKVLPGQIRLAIVYYALSLHFKSDPDRSISDSFMQDATRELDRSGVKFPRKPKIHTRPTTDRSFFRGL